LSIEQLANEVDSGRVDTVLVAIADMQGRLQGKRCDARFFLDHVRTDATDACNYLLAVDIEMRTVDGYAILVVGAWLRRLCHAADLNTLRWVPWQPAPSMHADVEWEDGGPVSPAPRPVLRPRFTLSERGWSRVRRY